MKKKIVSLICLCSILFGTVSILIPVRVSAANEETSTIERSDVPMKLWYTEEAPMINENKPNASGSESGDLGWEEYSLPIGNGYFGANVFGRTDKERIQITDKTMSNPEYFTDSNGKNYAAGGLNNFSETYIDFGHTDVSDYERYLDLNTAVSGVKYIYNNVKYTREYFASYPDNALIIRLDADTDGTLSFTLRPTVPFEQSYAAFAGDGGSKTGTVTSKVENNVSYVELSGTMNYYGIDFYGLYKVYTNGGTVTASTAENTYYDTDGTLITDTDGTIVVEGAKSAYIIVALGTDYELSGETFTETRENKPTQSTTLEYAKAKVVDRMNSIDSKIASLDYESSYKLLKKTHTDDHSALFGRVTLDLNFNESDLTVSTDKLLASYKSGKNSTYLEMLLYQYGRYLLIASSRSGALPANLQGSWNPYNNPAWGSGYWHNINVQMNYWHAFSTNLAETFDAYVDFNTAYMAQTEIYATDVIAATNPDALGKDGGNGWVIGTTNYQNDLTTDRLSVGNLGFTTQLYWEYYAYTKDKTILRQVYDVLANAARFITKAVKLDENGNYLVFRSDSPEMRVDGSWYETQGTTYSQTFAYLNNYNALLAADELGILENEELLSTEEYSILNTVMEQIDKYDPINVGLSGQVKEFREEDYYGSVGDDPNHRHISQLVGLFPGNLITASTPAWLDAAKVTLEGRGDNTTGGWVYSNRIGLYARAEMGEEAYEQLDALMSKSVQTNLFTKLWKVFQIDANFGATASMTEMLLQSHDGYIAPLPALPEAWADGSYTGLVARGNFEVSAAWKDGIATQFDILSKNGGSVSVKYPSIAGASVIRASDGKAVGFTSSGDIITFDTEANETYIITGFEEVIKPDAPLDFDYYRVALGSFNLNWSAVDNAVSYNVYVAEENASDYTLIATTSKNNYSYTPEIENYNLRTTFVVTAVSIDGVESDRSLCYYNPIDTSAKINDVSGHVLESGEFQVVIDADNAAKYKIFELKSGAAEYSLIAESGYPIITVDSFDSASKYAVSVVSFFDSAESKKMAIERLNGKSASYNPNNVLEGKVFVAASNAPAVNSTYTYDKLTDGIIDRANSANGRFACAKNRFADGTLDLNGKYILSNLRIYVFGIETGTNLTVDVYNEGQWKTVFYKETVAELAPYLDSDNVLNIYLGSVYAEKIRFYAKAAAETEYYVSYYEIECSGILVEQYGEYSENILLGKVFKPTADANALIYNSSYDYSKLTDGVIAQFSGRFSTKKEGYADLVFADAVVNLDGEYVLSKIRFYDYVAKNDYSENTATQMGQNFKLEIFSEGKWVTMAEYANNSDIQANHRVKTGKTGDGEGWIEFDLGNLKATAIRFYSETAGNSVTFYEIECSGYLINSEAEDNILLGKTFVPTADAYKQVYGDNHNTYGYATLTDGNKSATSGRFSSKHYGFADATLDLGGEYKLSSIRFYDFVANTTYEALVENFMGDNFKLEVFSDGEWVTIVSYATPEEFIKNHRIRTGNTGHSEGWLDISLNGIVASKIRFSSQAVAGRNTVSINEIECFGTQVAKNGEYKENVFENKVFVPTTEAYSYVYQQKHGTYGYATLTDGVMSSSNGRLSTSKDAIANATLNLGGEYYLDVLTVYDHSDNSSKNTAAFVGQNFKLEVLANGKWITLYSYASNDDIEANHRKTGSSLGRSRWLEFDLGHIRAEAVRFSSESVSGFAISIWEMICTGYSVTDMTSSISDNILVYSDAKLVVGSASSKNPISNINDGERNTYFEANATDCYTVEFDLGYIRSVHELKIYEVIDATNLIGGVLSTASNETTVEVYHNGEWIKVVNAVSLDVNKGYNTFNLYDIECSKIRVTFKNTRLFDSETTYRCAKISEIACTYKNIGTDRRPLLSVYEKLDKLVVNTRDYYDTMNKFGDYLVAMSMTDEMATDYAREMQSYYETTLKDIAASTSFVPITSITLGDNLSVNVYIPKENLVKFTFSDKVYDDLTVLEENEVTINGKIYYLIKTPIVAAEGLKELKLIATIDADENTITGSFTISIPKYAKKVLAGSSDVEKQIVRDVLSYIRAAYNYFDATNTDAMAVIDDIIGARYDETAPYTPEGSTETPDGLKAATFSLDSTPALKLYLPDGANASKYSFKINGRTVDFVTESDSYGTYEKIDLYAYQMCETITYYVDGTESGSYHIASYHAWSKTQNNEALVTLVERFWKYAQSARDYKNSVKVQINYTDENGNTLANSKTMKLAAGAEISVPSPAVSGYYTRDLYVKDTADRSKVINVVYKEIPENSDTATIKEKLSDIVCWGDSITYGALYNDVTSANAHNIDLTALGSIERGLPYVNVLENLIVASVYGGIDVANCGVGSDTTCQIAARANTETNYLYLSSETTISDSSVVIPFTHMAEYGRLGILRKDVRDTTSNVLIEGKDASGNTVYVTGKITCKLSDSAPSGTDIKTCDFSLLVYTFTRTDGKTNTVTFDAGTRIQTQESYIYDGRTCIIFMGENGGYNNDLNKLIEQQEEILAACGNPEYFLIISSTSKTTTDRKAITEALTKRWGANYINMGNELNSSRKSYEFAGYSEEAIVSIQEKIIDGSVSTLLIKDSCHPNAVGYAVAANIMFERLFELGAFDAIFDYYDSLR